MWPHPDDPLFPGQCPWRRRELQILVKSSWAAVQESVTPSIVVTICKGAIVETVIVDPVRDAHHGSWPSQWGDVMLCGGCGHVGGPRLRSHFGSTVAIYGQGKRRGGSGSVRQQLMKWFMGMWWNEKRQLRCGSMDLLCLGIWSIKLKAK